MLGATASPAACSSGAGGFSCSICACSLLGATALAAAGSAGAGGVSCFSCAGVVDVSPLLACAAAAVGAVAALGAGAASAPVGAVPEPALGARELELAACTVDFSATAVAAAPVFTAFGFDCAPSDSASASPVRAALEAGAASSPVPKHSLQSSSAQTSPVAAVAPALRFLVESRAAGLTSGAFFSIAPSAFSAFFFSSSFSWMPLTVKDRMSMFPPFPPFPPVESILPSFLPSLRGGICDLRSAARDPRLCGQS